MLGFSAAESSESHETRARVQRANKRSLAVVSDPPAPSVSTDAPESASSLPRLPDQETRRAIGHLFLAGSVLLDAVVLFVVPFLVFNMGGSHKKVVLLYTAVAMLLLLPTYRRGRVVPRPSEHLSTLIGRLALAPLVTSMAVMSMRTWFNGLPMDLLGQLITVSVLGILLSRLISFKLTHLVRSRGYDLEDTLIVGAGPVGVDVSKALSLNPEFGLVPVGFVDRFDERLPQPIVGRPEDLRGILEQTGIRHVVVSFGAASEEELVGYIRRCQGLPVQFYSVPRFFELGSYGHEVDGFPLVPMRRIGSQHRRWVGKRLFDVVVSAGLLIVSAPIFLAVAIAVKRSSPGPVFFRQIRIGLDGQPFEILKFRSMVVNDDSMTQWSPDDDGRVTRVGEFIRKSHLDELPQLVNVLRGEMSIVGPRPERPHFVERFGTEIDGYHHRHRVPAGITGWAQVNGYWGDTSIETRVRLDNRYIENWSLWRDLVIGLRTIPTLLGKRR